MEPLFVDTNLEYEMDMTLFPGWNDDFKRSEPQLLVHSFGICYCDFNCEDLRTDTDQDCSLEINPFEIIENSLFDDSLLESCPDTDDLLDMSRCVSPEIKIADNCLEYRNIETNHVDEFNKTPKRRLSDMCYHHNDSKRTRQNEEYDLHNDAEFHKVSISETSLEIPCDSIDSFLYSEDWDFVPGMPRG